MLRYVLTGKKPGDEDEVGDGCNAVGGEKFFNSICDLTN
jgi:hypothetical protein